MVKQLIIKHSKIMFFGLLQVFIILISLVLMALFVASFLSFFSYYVIQTPNMPKYQIYLAYPFWGVISFFMIVGIHWIGSDWVDD